MVPPLSSTLRLRSATPAPSHSPWSKSRAQRLAPALLRPSPHRCLTPKCERSHPQRWLHAKRPRTGHRVKRVLDDVRDRARDEIAIDENRGKAAGIAKSIRILHQARPDTDRRFREAGRRHRLNGSGPSATRQSSNSEAICRRSLTCVRIVATHSWRTGPSGSPGRRGRVADARR